MRRDASGSPRLAVFRADGGATIGGGHIVRCGSLAAALQRSGWHCGLAASEATMSYFKPLPSAFTQAVALHGDEPRDMAKRWPDGCDLLVVDHYDRDRDFEESCRPWAHRILALDDLADRPHDCDLLLDGTPGRSTEAYDGLLPDSCEPFMGADYLPLRNEFAVVRRRVLPRPHPGAPYRVLLCLGAGFVRNAVLELITALAANDMQISLDVAIGAPPLNDNLRDRIDAMGGRLHVATDAMANLVANADIAIGAAGVGGWERCCLGLPSVTLVLADNQKPNGAALAGAGAAKVLPAACSTDEIVAAMTGLLTDITDWERMSRNAARQCDGLGMARIVERIEIRWRDPAGAPIHLRPVRDDDAMLMLEWQTDPTTRRYARNPEPPDRKSHLEWFAAKSADAGCLFNVITRGGVPAGVLRLDRTDNSEAFEVSILVAPEHRRVGLSRAALDLGRRLVPDAALWAYIIPENTASLGLFRAAGYVKTERVNWYVNCADEAYNDE